MTLSDLATAALYRAGAFVLAQPGDPDPTSGHGPEWGKAAPAGLLIWLFMGAALFLLIKSMNRHMKRVPKTFDAPPAESAPGSVDRSVGDGATTASSEARTGSEPVRPGGDGSET